MYNKYKEKHMVLQERVQRWNSILEENKENTREGDDWSQ